MLIISVHAVEAAEGMWLPQLLRSLNEPDMRLHGLMIPADEIYSTDKISLKDAVVQFGGGCTGEIISSQGLVLTNHHCGFDQIQKHSSVGHNYLRDGFWAMKPEDEEPCPGLTVTFVVRIDDVTTSINALLNDTMTEESRNAAIKSISASLETKAKEGGRYDARVRQFFNGNDFYLIVTETFNDIRMVGAPPSSIGKFGGEEDNWIWPRHTGDFSIFRIYANKDNQPAEYSKDNKPYTPRKYFKIALNGVKENDFTMVFGFPGRTQEYITSDAVALLTEVNNPNRIRVRDVRMDIMGEAMRSSEKLNIQYAAKRSTTGNAWKKWRGESKGLIDADAVGMKRKSEAAFRTWTTQEGKKYAGVLDTLHNVYAYARPYSAATDYYAEAAFGIEVITYTGGYRTLHDLLKAANPDTAKINEELAKQKKGYSGFFRNYDKATDRKLMISLLGLFDKYVPDSLKPSYFTELRNRYNRDYTKLAESVYSETMFTDSSKVVSLLQTLNARNVKRITDDPAFRLADALYDFYTDKVASRMNEVNLKIARYNRLYMQGQRTMQQDKKFYPDANSTLRLAYGNVKGYKPRDGVYYDYQSTLDGIMEKYKPGDEEFDVPAKLVELYNKKDYGRYAENGKLPVGFIASNHTTGGNSGSPVLNARGELIGTNFDRVWEGTMSDVLFNPEICRNITLDIRYTLFIIDKFANAKRLIDELDIVQ